MQFCIVFAKKSYTAPMPASRRRKKTASGGGLERCGASGYVCLSVPPGKAARNLASSSGVKPASTMPKIFLEISSYAS